MAVLARITVGPINLLAVDADPTGADSAPQGSFALESVTPHRLWRNTDGATAWDLVVGVNPTAVASTPYTVLPSDTHLMVTVLAAIINLPAIADHGTGDLVVVDRAGTARLNPITLVPDGVETILGQANLQLDSNFVGAHLLGEGTDWGLR